MKRSITSYVLHVSFGIAVAAVMTPAMAVDGVTLIDQNKALVGGVTPGDTAGFPVTINLPGMYRLASNLVVPNETTTAILINADNVTIDMNGFAILGPNVCATDGFTVAQPCTRSSSNIFAGVGIDAGSGTAATVQNTRVINGTINGMGGIGIFANVNARIEGMNISNNGSYGIYTFGGAIRDTLLRANGNSGILTSSAVITGSRSLFNRGVGIEADNASIITDNIIHTNLGFGLVTTFNTRFTNNTIVNNNSGGIQVSGGTQVGVNTCNGVACP